MIMQFIERVAQECKFKQIPLTPCQLMYEVMNQITDEDVKAWDTNIVDIAEKIELVIELEGA
jgi:hypothetical protein